jgi:uncharacterized protein
VLRGLIVRVVGAVMSGAGIWRKMPIKGRAVMSRLNLPEQRLWLRTASKTRTSRRPVRNHHQTDVFGLQIRRSGDWGWGDRRSRGSPNRDFFSPFFGDRYERQAPAVDYSKAPAPRKIETPPTSTIVLIGDSMADWLGYGLDENYADQPEIGVERKIRATSGLVRYDAKNEALDWPQAAKDALANENPNAIVVMLGLNDRVPVREKAAAQPKQNSEPAQATNRGSPRPANQAGQEKTAAEKTVAPSDGEAPPQDAAAEKAAPQQQPSPGGSYEFHTDPWAAVYSKRIDQMIAVLKSKGVPVIWVGLPAIHGTKSTNDISYLDELYRERAERAGIVYVDVWDGFVDDQGRYAVQGPDYEGQIRRLRTADGVYFTKAGAMKLASYVDRELRRAMSSYVAPVALPGPETAPKSESTNARPDAGPVLPLASGGSEHDLLGAGDRPTQPTSDPTAAKVLSRGEALAAPAGRADDFAWPRARNDASATPEVSPEPVALAPGTTGKTGSKAQDQTDTKKDGKEKSRVGSPASRARQQPSARVDGQSISPGPFDR